MKTKEIEKIREEKKKEAIKFLKKVITEMKNYHKYGTELSDDVKEFALDYDPQIGLYFSEKDAREMLKFIRK